jgi:hypothetical protein
MMQLIKTVFLLIYLILLTSGIYRHDRKIDQYIELANEPQFDCVGQVFKKVNGTLEPIGSCVLIKDNYIISALHCFVGEVKKDTTIIQNGFRINSYIVTGKYIDTIFNYTIKFKDQTFSCEELMAYDSNLIEGKNDLALVKISPVIVDILPARLNKDFNELGCAAVGVGYGVTTTGDKPENLNPQPMKIAGENVVDSIGGPQVNADYSLLFLDFDHPDPTKNINRMGSGIPVNLEYLSSGGDSGGGLFRFKNNQWELVGICAGGNTDFDIMQKTGYYCQVMKWTRISAYADWIMEKIN